MRPIPSVHNDGDSLAQERRIVGLAGIALVLLFSGCATDTWSTKSPDDGSEYPGWTKALSLPLSGMSHGQSF